MTYKIDGMATSIAPIDVHWIPQKVGQDHNGAPVYSIYYNVSMSFDVSQPASALDWLNAASSGGSHSLTIPQRWSNASFVTYSPVFLELLEAPNYEVINLTPFRILASRVVP